MALLTYISLFSSAGVGCYGFKQTGFECIATNELVARRLDVQRFNSKCKYPSGYILGDVSDEVVKEKLFSEIEYWKKNDNLHEVDVLIATPPCQGMSVANHKKAEDEIIRNSLVIESIKIIQKVSPRIFIFENVPAFMKTACTDMDGQIKSIGEAIESNLGTEYSIYADTLNFKNYGACSSRTRTLVLAVRRDLADNFSPIELFPTSHNERTLREVIGELPALTQMRAIDIDDIFHAFRPYPEHMRDWISELAEGQTAFDNDDRMRIPHKVVDGKIVYNVRKNGDKYRRQIWDKVGPCVHTRNDQLASQNTIHPADDRVFSIRELMRMMTIPDEFKWVSQDLDELNRLTLPQKQKLLKKEAIKIRQSLGEAVPTEIFKSIASHISFFLNKTYLGKAHVKHEIDEHNLANTENLIKYIQINTLNLGYSTLCKIVEMSNANREKHAAFFTNTSLANEIVASLPHIDKPVIRILEPSVGAGNFLPLVFKRYSYAKKIRIDVVDIDTNTLRILKSLLCHVPNKNVEIEYINDDFLTAEFDTKYDLVIGNPPFEKLSSSNSLLKQYKRQAHNQQTNNIAAFFLEKALFLGDYVALVMPKFLLNTPEFAMTRDLLQQKKIDIILDFGEKGFDGVLVETIAICVNTGGKPAQTMVFSITDNKRLAQAQQYICDARFPYWVIYRDEQFDKVSDKLNFGIFEVFRDRQLTNSVLNTDNGIRVIRSRNISDCGTQIIDIPEYDTYIDATVAQNYSVCKFLLRDDVYLTPNMTYKPRVIRKPPNVLVNGSAAILIPKDGQAPLTTQELAYFASEEYREFYRTARNYQTRSLNVDSSSVFFFGRLKGGVKNEVVK